MFGNSHVLFSPTKPLSILRTASFHDKVANRGCFLRFGRKGQELTKIHRNALSIGRQRNSLDWSTDSFFDFHLRSHWAYSELNSSSTRLLIEDVSTDLVGKGKSRPESIEMLFRLVGNVIRWIDLPIHCSLFTYEAIEHTPNQILPRQGCSPRIFPPIRQERGRVDPNPSKCSFEQRLPLTVRMFGHLLFLPLPTETIDVLRDES